MSITLEQLTVGHFTDNFKCPPYENQSFRLHALLSGVKQKNTTYQDIAALGGKDRQDARQSFIKLHKHCISGQPFYELFDGTQFHKGHSFKYKQQVVNIFRFWLSGDIRIYILQLESNVVILKTLAKRQDDLNESEKKKLEALAKKVVDCSKSSKVNFNTVKELTTESKVITNAKKIGKKQANG